MKMLLLLLLMSSPVYSATVGSLALTGIIPKKVEISVTPAPSASSLDLETTQTNLSVGTLTGKSNSVAGYKISVSSANLGKLKHTVTPTQFVNYTLRIATTPIDLTTGGFINYVGVGTYTKDVNISYTGVDGFLFDNGNYTDTVTFTVSAN